MEDWSIWTLVAFCTFALWSIARHDWPRLTLPSRRVLARVSGHRESWENSSKSYAAIYSFSAEGGSHEVEDAVHSSFQLPAVGTMVELAYPEGRPDLARPPRLLMWTVIYGILFGLIALLLGLWMGWVA